MTKRLLAVLLLLSTAVLLCACPGGAPTTGGVCADCGKDPCECTPLPPTGGVTVSPEEADPSLIFGAGAPIDGAGDEIPANAPVLTEKTYTEAGATEIPAADFFTALTPDGTTYLAVGDSAVSLSRSGTTLQGHGSTLILPHGLRITDGKALTLEDLVIVGDVYIEGESLIFENVQFCGKVTVGQGAEGVVFHSCRFSSLDNAGTDTAVLSSFFAFRDTGIQNEGRGLYVQNCRMQGTGTAISSTGAALEVRKCTLKTDASGIGVKMVGAENSLVALSVITGGQESVLLQNALNTAVVKNSLVSVHTAGGKNVYICDNEMGGRVFAEENNYFLADGNAYPADGRDHRAVVRDNENVNGDTLTDVNARAEVGANEELLPHVDKDLFTYMERRATVREPERSREEGVYAYVTRHAEIEKYVVVAPGVYSTSGPVQLNAKHNDTVIYAYGVYVEAVEYENRNYAEGHIRVKGAENIAFKGLSIGFAQQSCGQIYILQKVSAGRVLAVAGAGFLNEFANSGSPFMSATDVGLQRAGTYYSLGDYFVSGVIKNADGTLTVLLTSAAYEAVEVGDVMTCRLGGSATVVSTNSSQNILYQDLTMYGYARAFAFYEYQNTGGVTYHRVLDTNRTGKVIDKATYERYQALEEQYGVDLEISVDTLPDGTLAFRGSPAHVSSIDAVHSDGSVHGSTVISSRFECICDDMSNQKSTHARLSDYIYNDDGTVTLIYKGNMSNYTYSQNGAAATWSAYCAPFRTGDRVYIYTSGGRVVCDGEALSASTYYDSLTATCEDVTPKEMARYAVTVKAEDFCEEALEGYFLADNHYRPDEKVLVDNMSRASFGFCFDNVLLENAERNGLRVKAAGGTVKNCTFRNVAKTAIAMIYEIWWGESGVAFDFTFEKNLVDHTGYAYDAPDLDDPGTSYRYTAICIMGLGGDVLDEEHMLIQNVLIKDNRFENRYLGHYDYLIYVRAAANITLVGNDFGSSEEEDGLDVFCRVLYLDRAVNVELSGNTYSPFVDPTAEHPDYFLTVNGTRYKNIFGSDVSVGGISGVKDKP